MKVSSEIFVKEGGGIRPIVWILFMVIALFLVTIILVGIAAGLVCLGLPLLLLLYVLTLGPSTGRRHRQGENFVRHNEGRAYRKR